MCFKEADRAAPGMRFAARRLCRNDYSHNPEIYSPSLCVKKNAWVQKCTLLQCGIHQTNNNYSYGYKLCTAPSHSFMATSVHSIRFSGNRTLALWASRWRSRNPRTPKRPHDSAYPDPRSPCHLARYVLVCEGRNAGADNANEQIMREEISKGFLR